MSQMIEMHSADHCVVVAELATSLKGVKFSKQRPDICKLGVSPSLVSRWREGYTFWSS